MTRSTSSKAKHSKVRACGVVLQLLTLVAATGCVNPMDQFTQGAAQQQPASEFTMPTFAATAEQPTANQQTASSDARANREPRMTAENSASGVVADPEALARTPLGPTTNHQSGTRIHAKRVVTADGQESWLGWHDSERNEDCSFERDGEGVLRCLPVSTLQPYFLDADCGQAVAVDASCSDETPTVAYVSEHNVCGIGQQARHVGSVLPAPTTVYSLRGDGTCVAVVVPSGTYYSLGDSIDSSHFVAAEYAVLDAPSRVKSYGIVAEDGTTQVTGFYDSDLEIGCAWSATSRERAMCAPQAQSISLYADSERTQPLIRENDVCATVTPDVALSYDKRDCSSTYYRSGERFDGDAVFVRGSGDGRPLGADEIVYQLGEQIEFTLPAMATLRRDLSAQGRLTPMFWKTLDGSLWFARWYDNLLQTECSFTRGATPLCVPKDAGTRIYYADSQCTDAVAEVNPANDCTTEVDPPAYVNVFEKNSCSGESQIVGTRKVLTPRVLDTVYESSNTGACTVHTAGNNSQHFAIGQLVPAAEFATGAVVAE